MFNPTLFMVLDFFVENLNVKTHDYIKNPF